MTKTTEELLADALARIELAKHALITQGYFKADELSDDIAPRITELASHLEQRAERLAAALRNISTTAKKWHGRDKVPFWNLGDIAAAALKAPANESETTK